MSDDTTKAEQMRRGPRFAEMAEQTGQGLVELAARLALPVTLDTAAPLAAAAELRAAEAAALAAMLRAVALTMARPEQAEGSEPAAPDEAEQPAPISPAAFAHNIADGASNLSKLLRDPRAAASLSRFAELLDKMATDAGELAAVLFEAESASPEGGEPTAPDEAGRPAPIEWEALRTAADATTRERFRRGVVELAELDEAVAFLAHGARRAVQDRAPYDNARPEPAQAVAEAHALLRQAVAQLRGFAACLKQAEERRPPGVSRLPVPDPARAEQESAAAFSVLTGASVLARPFSDVPGEPVEAMLRRLVDDSLPKAPGRAPAMLSFAFDVAKAWSMCAMEARRQMRAAETGMKPRADDNDAREVAKAWRGPNDKEFPGIVREWARIARRTMNAIAEGKAEGTKSKGGRPKITGVARERVEHFAKHILAKTGSHHPRDARGWGLVVDVYEARIAAMTKALPVAARAPGNRAHYPHGSALAKGAR